MFALHGTPASPRMRITSYLVCCRVHRAISSNSASELSRRSAPLSNRGSTANSGRSIAMQRASHIRVVTTMM